MWQTVITFIVVGIALFFIGRKLYRQIRRAVDPSQNVTCGCSGGCSACNVTCDDKNNNQSESIK